MSDSHFEMTTFYEFTSGKTVIATYILVQSNQRLNYCAIQKMHPGCVCYPGGIPYSTDAKATIVVIDVDQEEKFQILSLREMLGYSDDEQLKQNYDLATDIMSDMLRRHTKIEPSRTIGDEYLYDPSDDED